MKRSTVTSLISAALLVSGVGVLWGLAAAPSAYGRPNAVTDLNSDQIQGDNYGHLATTAGQGFIGIAPNKKYFQYANGTPFVPVGHNDAFDMSLIFNPTRLDNYFKHMSENGENVLRVLLDGWGDTLIELKVGQFNPTVEEGVDNLVRAAEKHGIYLIISLWISIHEYSLIPGFAQAWGTHPYNLNQPGGLVASGLDLLTNPAAIAAQKNRLLFFIERWGASPNIFAWELWNEIDAMRKDQSVGATDTLHLHNRWIDEVGAFLRQEETRRFGRHHLRTVSVSNAGWGTGLSGMYTGDELDFTSYHTYDNALMVGVNPWSGQQGRSQLDPIRYFQFTYESARMATAKSGFRPVVGTEDVQISPLSAQPPAFDGFTQKQLDDIFTGTIWSGVWAGARAETCAGPVPDTARGPIRRDTGG